MKRRILLVALGIAALVTIGLLTDPVTDHRAACDVYELNGVANAKC